MSVTEPHRALDGHPFHLIQRERNIFPGQSWTLRYHLTHVLLGNGLRMIRGQRTHTLQQVLQLAHIGRERMIQKAFKGSTAYCYMLPVDLRTTGTERWRNRASA